MPEIMVSAGEVSGDMHAAALVRRLREYNSEIKFWGVGGLRLAGAGTEIVCNTVEKSVLGISDSLKRISFYYLLYRDLKKKIRERKPDLILLVDFTTFNIKLAQFGHKAGIPVVSFFSPSAWAWGGWRAARMARWKAKIAAVTPMEYQVYSKAGADVCYVGHPLTHMIKKRERLLDLRECIKTGKYSRVVGILPGSRESEVKSLLGDFLRAAEIIHEKYGDTLFVLPLAAPHLKGLVERIAALSGAQIPLVIVDGMAWDVLEISQLAITASGSATLEAACLGTPILVAYRISLFSELFFRVLAKVRYTSLPNLILGEQVVPEFFQKRADGRVLGQAALRLLEDSDALERMKAKLSEAAGLLGDGNAVNRTAGLILDILESRRT